jgi:hypothetical protein
VSEASVTLPRAGLAGHSGTDLVQILKNQCPSATNFQK